MHITYLQSKKSICHIMLLSLGTMVFGCCSQSHPLGVEGDTQELLNAKLADPNLVLRTEQSISLVKHCTQLGEQNAEDTDNKGSHYHPRRDRSR